MKESNVRKIARDMSKRENSDESDTMTTMDSQGKRPTAKLPRSLAELQKLIKFDDVIDE